MSELARFRDHARAMATAVHRVECEGPQWNGGLVLVRPNPGCPGCVTDADRARWADLADEVDDYLAPQPDLFGAESPEPVAEPPPQ